MALEELNVLDLSEKELKAILWIDDVEGINNEIIGTDVLFFRGDDSDLWQRIISLEDVANNIHLQLDLENEAYY